MTSIMKNIDVLGVKICSTTMSEVLEKLKFQIKSGEANRKTAYFVATVNPEFVLQAQNDREFMKILNAVDLAIPDGHGLRLAYPFPEIIPGRILVEKLLHKDYRVFFLGGRDGVAKELASKYGFEGDEGEKDIRNGETDSVRILSSIKKAHPDVLLVAYGAPWQEKWIAKHLKDIEAKVVIGVGGAFDYLAGRASVPPVWVADAGFEWLWRLVHEPWRIKRQLVGARFFWLVLKQKYIL